MTTRPCVVRAREPAGVLLLTSATVFIRTAILMPTNPSIATFIINQIQVAMLMLCEFYYPSGIIFCLRKDPLNSCYCFKN